MRKEYDFSKGRRGAIVKPAPAKTRITVRIDTDILDWFRSQVELAGGGNYQTLLNDALRAYVEDQQESIETLVRRVVREELKKAPTGRRPKKAA
jgi:hypothetical protein